MRVLHGHAHWVNHMCLSTMNVMRTGCYEPANAQSQKIPSQLEEKRLGLGLWWEREAVC